jgi:hypothetical protein
MRKAHNSQVAASCHLPIAFGMWWLMLSQWRDRSVPVVVLQLNVVLNVVEQEGVNESYLKVSTRSLFVLTFNRTARQVASNSGPRVSPSRWSV